MFTLALLLIVSMPTWAQNQIKPVVYAGGGIDLLLSPDLLKDYWKMGYGFGGGVGIQVKPNLELIGRVSFNTFPFDADKFLDDMDAPAGVSVDGLDFRSLEFGADMKYIFMSDQANMMFKPFVVAGLGFANIKATDATITAEDEDDIEEVHLPFGDASETDFSFNFGGGFDYMFAPKAGAWVDVRYTYIASEGDAISYLPIRAGVKFLFGN